MPRIYLFTNLCLFERQLLKSNGQGTSGKRMGGGWQYLLIQLIKTEKNLKAHSRNKTIKSNQTHFPSPSLAFLSGLSHLRYITSVALKES